MYDRGDHIGDSRDDERRGAARSGRELLRPAALQEVRLANGEKFTLCVDMDRLRTEILRLAPEDKDLIDTLVRHMEAFGRIDVPLDVGIRRMLPALGLTRLFKKYSMTRPVVAMRLSNPRMR